jgi:hypothetical protein
MNGKNDVRPRAHKHFIAAFEERPPEIRGGEILLLHHCAHGAVEYEDSPLERVEKGFAALCSVTHSGIPRKWCGF